MYIRIRPPLSSCDYKPPRSKKQEDQTSVTHMYLGIESLAYWSRAADENFSFAKVWWIHAASSCLDLYDRSETHVQGMCLMPDKTQSKSWQVWGMCILPKKAQSESRCILHQWRAGRLQLTDHISLLKSKCVPYYVSIGQISKKAARKVFGGVHQSSLRKHSYYDICMPPNIAANQTLRPVNSINHRSDEKPSVELQRHLHQCSYFHHASSCCHNVSFELVEYYCGCMSDLHTSSWLMFAASRF
jgi:hypothetical protein